MDNSIFSIFHSFAATLYEGSGDDGSGSTEMPGSENASEATTVSEIELSSDSSSPAIDSTSPADDQTSASSSSGAQMETTTSGESETFAATQTTSEQSSESSTDSQSSSASNSDSTEATGKLIISIYFPPLLSMTEEKLARIM